MVSTNNQFLMKIKLLLSFFLIQTFLIVNAATPPNATIAYNSPICSSSGLQPVIFSGTSGGTFSASPSGLSIDATTGSITPNQSLAGTYVVTYTIPPGVDPMFETTTIVTINNNFLPQFAQIAPICVNSQAPALPTTSMDGVTGSWSPPVIETQIVGTDLYLFTPDAGQCASSQTISITVSSSIEPTFAFSSSTVCSGNAPVLPTVSTNGISGTWSPSTVTTSGTYTFTPDPNQCATTATTTFQVNPAPTAMFSFSSMTVCEGTPVVISILGTPNSTVTYSYNSSFNQTITLDSNGIATLTSILSASTAICLISVESWSAGSCTTPLTGCCVITVVPNVFIIPMPDVTYCTEYILPALPVGNYFTQPGGSGTMLNAGDVITSTQTIYVFAATTTTPSCVSEDSFQVTIIPAVSPTISTVDNINYIIVEDNQIIQTLQLNTEVQTGNYSYQWMESQNDIIGANSPSYIVNNLVNGGLHYYSVRITNNDTNCVSQSLAFQVFEIPVPAPIGDPNQTFTPGQTLADVIVSGQNIQWYDALNRNTTSNPLPLSTVLVEGVTYFATQTINGYESASSFEIMIQFLANDSFAFKDLKFSPNPVRDVLLVESKDMIKDVTVFNIMGQKILQQHFESLDLRLSLSQLKAGNYFIKLESDNKSQVIKVIKE